MEIAIFGGTFDPPTKAHEAIVRACVEREDLDQVWLMPSGVREDKAAMQSDGIRLHMLEILRASLFDGNQKLIISDFELQLPRPTKTTQTFKALEAAYPNDHFFFVFGADSYQTMEDWEDGIHLKHSIGMLLVGRAGYCLPPESKHIKHLSVPYNPLNVSSTLVRESVQKGLPIKSYVSQHIRKFILEKGLYGHATIDG